MRERKDRPISDEKHIADIQQAIVNELAREGYKVQYGWTSHNCKKVAERMTCKDLDIAKSIIDSDYNRYTPEYKQAIEEELEIRMERLMLGNSK